jgi:hypothetical protein
MSDECNSFPLAPLCYDPYYEKLVFFDLGDDGYLLLYSILIASLYRHRVACCVLLVVDVRSVFGKSWLISRLLVPSV